MSSANKFIPKDQPVQLRTIHKRQKESQAMSKGDRTLLRHAKLDWRNEMRTNNSTFKAKQHKL